MKMAKHRDNNRKANIQCTIYSTLRIYISKCHYKCVTIINYFTRNCVTVASNDFYNVHKNTNSVAQYNTSSKHEARLKWYKCSTTRVREKKTVYEREDEERKGERDWARNHRQQHRFQSVQRNVYYKSDRLVRICNQSLKIK